MIEKNKCFPIMSQMLFYSMDGKHSTAEGIVYVLNEDIDFTVMEASYLRAVKRFPYFNVKIKSENNALYREWVEDPLPLQRDAEDYIINEADNNGYLYRVSVIGNKLSIQMFHGLSDGAGINNFSKLILSIYYEKKGETVSEINDLSGFDNIGLADSDNNVTDDEDYFIEYMDPLDSEIFDDVVGTRAHDSKFYIVPEKKDRVLEINYFSCNGYDLMEYVKNIDGTPNAVTAVMLAKAMVKIYPESIKHIIRAGVTINGKSFMGLTKNNTPFMNVSAFDFDEKMLSMDNETLHTCVRGKIMKDCFDDILISKFAAIKNIEKIYKLMPSLSAKKLLSYMSVGIPTCTFSVSYAGCCNMGSIEKHIKSVYCFADSSVPLMEINYVNGRFFFCLSTKFDGKNYMSLFAEELKQIGIICSDISTIHFKEGVGKADKKIRFGLNRATLEMINAVRKMKKQ